MLIDSQSRKIKEENITLRNVSCGYPPRFSNVLINLSIGFDVGCITAIVGCNGSGKSTLMRCLSGLLKLNHGAVDIFGANPQVNFREWNQTCAYVSQQPTFDHEMTGLEILDYFSCMYGQAKEERRQRISSLIDLMNLNDIKSRKISSYSGGNLQKVHLAIGLINDPELLLFDEPTNNLDAMAKHRFWSYLKSLSSDERKTSIVISHDLEFIEQYADVLVVMDRGAIRYQGSVRNFIDDSTVHEQSGSNLVADKAHMPRTSLFDALSRAIHFDMNKTAHSHYGERGSRRGQRNQNRRRGER